MRRSKWIWMPHPGHFIGGAECKFHLNTYVGKYIVSTVGEYRPPFLDKMLDELERKQAFGSMLHVDENGNSLLGYNRTFETMVFEAHPRTNDGIAEEDGCCPWEINPSIEIDMQGYNSSGDAYKGHMEMCKKWS